MSSILTTHVISSPIGAISITGGALGLQSIKKTDGPVSLPSDLPDCIDKATKQLGAYFERRRTVFELEFDWSGHPDFSVEVWQELQNIPYGSTTTYSAIAERMGQPKAVRAVGMANRNNPFAIVVPCHRVIGKSGDLTGYFYGLDTKLQLLRLENPKRYPEQLTLL